MKKSVLFFATVSCLFAASPANAAELLFDFDLPGWQTQFIFDSNPTPSGGGPGFRFFSAIPTSVNGVNDTANLTIFDTTGVGGANFGYNSLSNTSLNRIFSGPKLYSGTLSNPVFSVGTYSITNFGSATSGSLRISEVATAVPEPATWAMMFIGLGLVGASMRRSSRKQAILRRSVRFAA